MITDSWWIQIYVSKGATDVAAKTSTQIYFDVGIIKFMRLILSPFFVLLLLLSHFVDAPSNRSHGSFPFNCTNICLSQHTDAQRAHFSFSCCFRVVGVFVFFSSGADERKLNIPNMIIITAFIVRPHQDRRRARARTGEEFRHTHWYRHKYFRIKISYLFHLLLLVWSFFFFLLVLT